MCDEEKKQMGEEDKKSAGDEEKKDETKEGKKPEESKAEQPPPSPPPIEIILKVYMHCEGCATKVRRCLKGFEGVEDVKTYCRMSKVVVKGEKADPLKVLERVRNKSHRQVDLISPIPKKPQEKELPIIKSEEKKEEHVITTVLGVYMHCEACAQEIKKRIQTMKGVESVEPDLKKSQVTVKGVFEPEALVEYVHRRTGKHAAIVGTEAEKEGEGKGGGRELEKKVEEGGKDDNGGGGEPPFKPVEVAETWGLETKKSESHSGAQNHELLFVAEWPALEYPPQMFSDENPNACAVM